MGDTILTNCKGCDIEMDWLPDADEPKLCDDCLVGNCHKCGEPLNNGEGEFCFKCKVAKANI
jgi:hypothetical protein